MLIPILGSRKKKNTHIGCYIHIFCGDLSNVVIKHLGQKYVMASGQFTDELNHQLSKITSVH